MDELSKIRGARFSSLVENERAGADLVTEILYHHWLCGKTLKIPEMNW